MSLFLNQVRTHARIQFLRHLRSPAIWLLALAAPIAARFLVPNADADYAVLAVNDAYLTLDPAVIGLQLGVIMAVLLSPLAYIFLRAGSTRRQPWQADDLTPANRSAQMFGHWVADTGALWLLVLVLALAGVLLSLFRLPISEINPIVTMLTLAIIAAPAMAVIAGIRILFSIRHGLRKAGGDVLFFFIWIGLIVLSSIYFETGSTSSIWDVFGFAAPIDNATDLEIDSFVLGGSVATSGTLEIDAWRGVTTGDYLVTRVFWIVATGLAVASLGSFYGPHNIKSSRAEIGQSVSGPVSFESQAIPAVAPASSIIPILQSEARLAFRPRLLWLAFVLVGLAGAVLEFRGAIGPALALLLIFPLTRHGARWRGSEMSKLSALTSSGPNEFVLRCAAVMGVCLLLTLPAALRLVLTGASNQFLDIAAISIGLPLVAITLGHVTRSAIAARLVLLIIWYGYLNL